MALATAWYYRVELWVWWVTSEAFVNCTVGAEVIACLVEQRGGTVPAHVCWDVVVVCANGNRSTANACLDVQPDQTATRAVRWGDFIPSMDHCDTVQSMAADHFVSKQLR